MTCWWKDKYIHHYINEIQVIKKKSKIESTLYIFDFLKFSALRNTKKNTLKTRLAPHKITRYQWKMCEKVS